MSASPAGKPPAGLVALRRRKEMRRDLLREAEPDIPASAIRWLRSVRGRDVRRRTPPAQIRTSGFPASGSYLRCLTAKRRLGQG
jgi:hypothetical protein